MPELQPQMLQCYAQCEDIAAALMGLFAVALGLQQQHFDAALRRHHSNMQVCICWWRQQHAEVKEPLQRLARSLGTNT